MAATAIDPYKAYSEMYKKRTDAINAQAKQAELERTNREQQAQTTLANANRGVYTTYKNAINPYGRMASQNNFSQGVSDYYNNASYGTMLQGLGTNQYNFNDAINNSNSLWQSYLAEKAGQEAEALNDYNAGVLAQQKYDKEQEIAEAERQEAIRQFNLKIEMQKAAEAEDKRRWEAEQTENKRRYDQEWAAQEAARKAASSGSGSGGGSYSRSSSSNSDDYSFDTYQPGKYLEDNYTTKGAMDTRKSAAGNIKSTNQLLAKTAKSSKETDSDANLITKQWTRKLPNGKKVQYTRYKNGRTTSKQL